MNSNDSHAGRITQIVNKSVSLIIVLLTKFYTSSQVGQVALALAIVTPLSFLFNMSSIAAESMSGPLDPTETTYHLLE